MLYVKLIVMPIVMIIVTLASKKWGNTVGGLIASLPWVAGPILIFISLEQGKEFVVNSLPGVLVGIMGWLVFCSTFVVVGERYKAFWALIAGYIAYFIWGGLMKEVLDLYGMHTWYIITFLAVLIVLKLFPKVKNDAKESDKKLKYDLLLRVMMITSFVLALTHFAKLLGPGWSGIMAPFPIMTAVLGVFVHYTQGNYQTRTLFYGLLFGSFGFITFLLLLYHTLPHFSIFLSFLIAMGSNVVINLGLHFLLARRRPSYDNPPNS
jgi:hypothetical protein